MLQPSAQSPVHWCRTGSAPRSEVKAHMPRPTDLVDQCQEMSVAPFENCLLIGSDVETEENFASHLAECVELRVGRDLADRDRRVRTRSVEFRPELVEAERKLGHPQHGVAAEPARHRARVVVSSAADCMAVSHAARNPGYQTDRNRRLIEHRPLLDVDFDICMDCLSFKPGLAGRHAFWLQAELLHVLRKRLPGVRTLERQRLPGEETESGAAADIGCGEPRALLGSKRCASDRTSRLNSMPEQARDDRYGGHHACSAVEIASMGYRIEM